MLVASLIQAATDKDELKIAAELLLNGLFAYSLKYKYIIIGEFFLGQQKKDLQCL
jgi:hypothetical protein